MTQIQEQTLVQVPKMFGVVLVILLVLPWMFQLLLNFTAQLFVHIPEYVR
jgi:flagellar biosynthesis protein FliQ